MVTANKALVAMYLTEIQQLLKEHPGVTFGYEAAVCGGELCVARCVCIIVMTGGDLFFSSASKNTRIFI